MIFSRGTLIFTIIMVGACVLLAAGASPKFNPASNRASSEIDRSFEMIWSQKGITPAAESTDEEFLRRIYLDLIGRIPRSNEAREFLRSNEANKRNQLILRLLNSEDWSEYYASQFTALFLGYNRDRFVDRQQFQTWFQHQLDQDQGWDLIARGMLTAEGNLAENPALNWYSRHRLDPVNLADDTARHFLGLQLGCARCHDHPHDQWKMEDFYGLAAFYSGIRRDDPTFFEKRKIRELKRKRQEMVKQFKGENLAALRRSGEAKEMAADLREVLRLTQDPSESISTEVAGTMKSYPAKFLLQNGSAHITDQKREALAEWMISQSNPFFAVAFVNRAWSNLMGKGFVEPVDDMGQLNQPDNPELLKLLARDFVSHGYNIRHLHYIITTSNAYQRSSKTNSTEPPHFYERSKVRMLNADQLLNSFLIATSMDVSLKMKERSEYEEKLDMIRRHHVFLFDNDENPGNNTQFEGTISQALFLLNGKMTNESVEPLPGNTMSKLFSKRKDPDMRIEELYLGTYSRFPTEEERDQMRVFLQGKEERDGPYEDILWALLNSNEFLFNH